MFLDAVPFEDFTSCLNTHLHALHNHACYHDNSEEAIGEKAGPYWERGVKGEVCPLCVVLRAAEKMIFLIDLTYSSVKQLQNKQRRNCMNIKKFH